MFIKQSLPISNIIKKGVTLSPVVTKVFIYSQIPNNPVNDYDWVVYNFTDAECSDIYYDFSSEISGNWSGIPGYTGATEGPNLNRRNAGGTTSRLVNVQILPFQYTVAYGGSFCEGMPGPHVYLAGNESGPYVNYEFYLNDNSISQVIVGTGLGSSSEMEVLDMTGQIPSKKTFGYNGLNRYVEPIGLSVYKNGVYLLKIFDTHFVLLNKIILER
jgi:hypothetical protein